MRRSVLVTGGYWPFRDLRGGQGASAADVHLTGPLADWNAHLSLVRDKAAPLPEPLAALLVELTEQLNATATDAPLAALRAAGMLERIAARVGREAVGVLADDGVSAEAVATGLGTAYSKTLVMLLTTHGRWRSAPQHDPCWFGISPSPEPARL
ncbi:hypothetical protein ACFCYH_35270 [Streptomyces sp. NPDC056400]|uniref:hypothetical protein n=1 Tax=Streptomyces sp. NPDC056400 TaxID=3345808 RepID=UPI0035DA3E0A